MHSCCSFCRLRLRCCQTTHLASAPVAFAAPAPVITATSSQVVARNHNGIAFAPVVAPAAIAPVAPLAKVVAPVAAAPLAAPIAPLAAPAPLIARYAAAPAPWSPVMLLLLRPSPTQLLWPLLMLHRLLLSHMLLPMHQLCVMLLPRLCGNLTNYENLQ
ncbi:unnamed protein product [Ceratitis capitata]|uniref:(Mediterranean fruit fly) hypothetical protein n=1 Tax=Ceratitis capitata TaxID=7213 RepID=A0A811UYZ8_CERCA|nr:unnamed protein product [Ceratitis capitata]